MMKILCLAKSFKSQTSSGGYDQLAKFIGARTVQRPVISSIPMRLIEKAWHFGFGNKPHLFSNLSHGYHFDDRLCEEKAYWRAITYRPDIIHILYGDFTLDMLLRRGRLGSAHLVATFHLPAEAVADRFERVQKEAFKELGGAVLLSSNELAIYSSWLGPEKVMYIPHGIDIDVFRPGEFVPRKMARLMFIGMALRDFETTHRIIDRCRQEGVAVEFIIIIPEEARSYFTGCTNAQIMSNIDEQKLISLYQSSDALFLPLLQSTANNAILEALACGLPVMSTRIGGVPDYVDESCGWLIPPADFETAYRCVRRIVRDREEAWGKRKAARLKAEKFSWDRVSVTLLEAYARLRETGRFAPDTAMSSVSEIARSNHRLAQS